ncbi:MAG: hypothetical protein Q8Q00_12855 [Dehalococcoidia bacterium]|nr:hypothetical protein [Dehalococcoidia bacterium]
MRISAPGAFLLATVTAILLLAGVVVPQDEAVAQGPVTLAVDADPTGNTATSVGNIEDCRSVDTGDTLEVDIIVTNVVNLLGWEGFFEYEKSILEVTNVDVRLFQAANSRSNVINASETPPDTDGLYLVAAADNSKSTDSGSGVLARLTLRGVGTGISPAKLLKNRDFNGDGVPDLGPILSALTFDTIEHVGDENGDGLFDGTTRDARIAVGVPCSVVAPTPTPTPGAGQTPGPGSGTPTPTPKPSDTDQDRVADVDDRCPGTSGGSSVDASGCSDTQMEALTEEAKDELLAALAAGLNLNVSLDTVAVGGSTSVIAVVADENEKPVSGVDISFKIEEQPGSDADLEDKAKVTKTSDADGFAEATLNVGSTPGEIVVSATAEGLTETVTVTIAVESAAETPDPADAVAQEPSGSVPVPGGAGSGGGGLPTWMLAVIVVAALALVAGVLAAWRAARDRPF